MDKAKKVTKVPAKKATGEKEPTKAPPPARKGGYVPGAPVERPTESLKPVEKPTRSLGT